MTDARRHRRLDLRLGIDVGGTNTDAVILDRDDQLIAKAKSPTSPDVTAGIEAAVDAVLAAGEVDRARISHAMLGTTHATNAVLERRRLHRVAVLRIGAPATLSVRPLLTWPDDLRRVVSGGEAVVRGGIELDGRDIVPFDGDAVRDFLLPLRGTVDAVAITSVFAPVSNRHELAAAAIARQVMGPDVHLSLSHELGALGLLERENSTVLNGALLGVAREVAGTLRDALARRGISPELFFAQNDGTLMALDHAVRFPVLTIGSGPANSLRGAAYLTGRSDALVIDVGGTSTDIGVLVGGFPRESSQAVEIGGIRTNFRMPDIVSIAVGGGTIVREGSIGPDSVAYRIATEALAFGGTTPTLTDAAITAGRASDIGSVRPGAGYAALLAAGLALADVAVAEAIDRVKTARADAPAHLRWRRQHRAAGQHPRRQRDAAAAPSRRRQCHRRGHRGRQRQRRGGPLVPRTRPCRGRRGHRRARPAGGRRGRRRPEPVSRSWMWRRLRSRISWSRPRASASRPPVRWPSGSDITQQQPGHHKEEERGMGITMSRRAATASGALLLALGMLATPMAGALAQDQTADTFTYATHTSVITDWDPATSYLQRGHRLPQHLRVPDALRRRDRQGPARAGHRLEGQRGRPDVDVHAAPGVTFHTGRVLDAAAAKAAIERTQTTGRGRRLHLGTGQEHRHARCADARLQPLLSGSAGPHRLGQLRRLHLRHPGRRSRCHRRPARRLVQERQGRRHRPVHGRRLEDGR